MSSRKVAVIGAGPSGLVAAKECIEAGLEVVIFEKESSLGGVWNPNSGKIWNSMKTNLSHFHMGFSDHLWPQDIQDFPSGCEVLLYLQSYAKQFALTSKIHYQQKVSKVTYSQTSKKWHIYTDKVNKHECDYIIFSSGVFGAPNIPWLPGQEKFAGDIIHSQYYREAADFYNKRVVVIGGSFSGYEIASDLANMGIDVSHVFTKPAWIANRYISYNNASAPLDIVSYSHSNGIQLKADEHERTKSRIKFFKTTYGNPGDTHPALLVEENFNLPVYVVISDDYIDNVRNRRLIPYNNALEQLMRKCCVLSSGQRVHADVIILCTGYFAILPIQNKLLKNVLNYDINDRLQPLILNKCTLHPKLPHLAFVGLYRGPFFGVMEMQARWAAAIFSQKIPYPDLKSSMMELRKEKKLRQRFPRPQFPHANYVEFMHEIGIELGVQPLDLLAELQFKEEIPMIPSDFRRFGINPNVAVADKQRQRLINRLEN